MSRINCVCMFRSATFDNQLNTCTQNASVKCLRSLKHLTLLVGSKESLQQILVNCWLRINIACILSTWVMVFYALSIWRDIRTTFCIYIIHTYEYKTKKMFYVRVVSCQYSRAAVHTLVNMFARRVLIASARPKARFQLAELVVWYPPGSNCERTHGPHRVGGAGVIFCCSCVLKYIQKNVSAHAPNTHMPSHRSEFQISDAVVGNASNCDGLSWSLLLLKFNECYYSRSIPIPLKDIREDTVSGWKKMNTN